MNLRERLKQIRLILSDVDGVMTDGGIIYDNQGIESKCFSVRDGLGVKLWQKAGYKFGIITGRTSQVVKIRTAELGVDIVRQGFSAKLPAAIEIMESLKLKPEQVCYIGDDLPDLNVIRHVGVGVAAADAVAEVRAAAQLTTVAAGGRGVVREVVETILQAQDRWNELLVPFG
ncbi:MAG: HAD hydrolase family protein [bacterium]|nr:HAD hydrolase family protein [bacterium]